MPRELFHPRLADVGLGAVYGALADEHRRRVVVELARRPGEEIPCSRLAVPGAKSTRSYHWKVLREAGLIVQRPGPGGMLLRLRPEFEERFPGLLDNLLRLAGAVRGAGTPG